MTSIKRGNSIPMSKEVLNIIHAVRDYKRFLESYHIHLLEDKNFDVEYAVKEFFLDIVSDDSIPTSNDGFNAILNLPQERLNHFDMIKSEYLGEYFFKY